jgi:outer membrane lipoprotein
MRVRSSFTGLLLLFVMCAGCASTQETGDGQAASQIEFPQVKSAPDSFKGQPVVFGGQVLSARRLKEGTRIEILQLPLDRSGQPGYDLTQSQGRFLAVQRDFLDPATLPHGTLVTVTGQVTGSITLPLDETEYHYPVVDIRQLQVWNRSPDPAPRIRPQIGPGPYWGPYWSPYWRPWPYRW